MPRLPTVSGDLPRSLKVWTDRVREIIESIPDSMLGAQSRPGSPQTLLPAPRSVTAVASRDTVAVTWPKAPVAGVAFSDLYAATSNSTNLAKRLDRTAGTEFVHQVKHGETWYYWVRYIGADGTEGPFHSQNGASARSTDSASYYASLLNNQLGPEHIRSESITERQLRLHAGSVTTTGRATGTGDQSVVLTLYVPIDAVAILVFADSAITADSSNAQNAVYINGHGLNESAVQSGYVEYIRNSYSLSGDLENGYTLSGSSNTYTATVRGRSAVSAHGIIELPAEGTYTFTITNDVVSAANVLHATAIALLR